MQMTKLNKRECKGDILEGWEVSETLEFRVGLGTSLGFSWEPLPEIPDLSMLNSQSKRLSDYKNHSAFYNAYSILSSCKSSNLGILIPSLP